MFEHGAIHLATEAIHTVRPLAVDIPLGRLTAITGVSGSGKSTLLLEGLVPALQSPAPAPSRPRRMCAIW